MGKTKSRVETEITEHQTIWADRNQITQVLVNLLQNALPCAGQEKMGLKSEADHLVRAHRGKRREPD